MNFHFGKSSLDWRPEFVSFVINQQKGSNPDLNFMQNSIFSLIGILLLIFQIIFNIKSAHGQFYNIYPAARIAPNLFPLNSSSIPLAAFLALTILDGDDPLVSTSLEVICIECQTELINSNPDLLPGMKIDILYYDTSEINTSKASIAALEYSLASNHIASLGKN